VNNHLACFKLYIMTYERYAKPIFWCELYYPFLAGV